MSRVKSDREFFTVNTSGPLKEELRKHAYQRCRHFFLYVFYFRVLIDWLNSNYKMGLSPASVLNVNASHQADTGSRSDNDKNFAFDAKNANIVDQLCTAFLSMDATHFCNLGIAQAYDNKFSNMGAQDEMVGTLYLSLTNICRNTRQLPQRVNIGPDKIIDKFHGVLATQILNSGKPPVSTSNLGAYFLGVTKELTVYKNTQLLKGNKGVAACVDAYLECYAKDLEELWKNIINNVAAECNALNLDLATYLSLS